MDFDREMEAALIADGEKLRALTGEDHGPWGMTDDAAADCTFLYFKPSGKWKYEGRGRFPRPVSDGWHDINRDEIIRENGSMPGISSRGSDLVIIISPDNACNVRTAYPRMLRPEEFE